VSIDLAPLADIPAERREIVIHSLFSAINAWTNEAQPSCPGCSVLLAAIYDQAEILSVLYPKEEIGT